MFPNLHLLRWTLHKLINHITLKKTKKYSGQLWLGAFKNIEEMEHSLKNSPWSLPNKDRAPPFPNLEWEEYAKKISLQNYEYGTPLSILEIERHGFLIEYYSNISDINKILDFGGGLNPCYFSICKSKKNAGENLYCDVVELSGVSKYANDFYSKIPRLKYYDQFPSKKHYDLIYLGASLQYLFDLDIFFQEIISYSAKYIIISNSHVALKSKTFFSAPLSNHKILFPNITYNLEFLGEKAKQFGYLMTYSENIDGSRRDDKDFQPYTWMFPNDVYTYDIVLKKL